MVRSVLSIFSDAPSIVVIEPFDRFVAIDFSASSVPAHGENSLWIAWGDATGKIRTHNALTRRALLDVTADLVFAGSRTLLVMDIALGWPDGMAAVLGLNGVPWRATRKWFSERLVDDENNRNNRFDVAASANQRAGRALFWGHPHTQSFTTLGPTTFVPRGLRPRGIDARRLIEHEVGGAIKSPFQLTGIGSVGSQSLLGQLFVERLRQRGRLRQWPFESATGQVVVGEYFFSLAPWQKESGATKDERQVRAVVRWLRRRHAAGDPLVTSSLLELLTPTARAIVQREEGWLVGVRANHAETRRNHGGVTHRG